MASERSMAIHRRVNGMEKRREIQNGDSKFVKRKCFGAKHRILEGSTELHPMVQEALMKGMKERDPSSSPSSQ
ncbi:hypothetical protein CAEBREN_19048 [Caenorhabditis brenneri]|uniref:Uncharacterized protein n=1 Tax=Caenorhabditis brenneri TaxID=135651 RepID=G0P868_CAEBE|nr:hypothetical protein CAEBREN_19048 [Caenorhabditis brenneri]